MTELTALIDFGSTFTKVKAVDPEGRLLAAAQHRTTIDTDVHEGLTAALSALEEGIDGPPTRRFACSSAGGGLRVGVVGLVEELTAEAARQAALGGGARVLEVVAGGLDGPDAARALLGADPDIVLLVGGTDGGDREVLIASAAALAAAGVAVPVVIAGNVEAQEDAAAALADSEATVVSAANVMPTVDTLAPDAAREVIRDLFITHVIGGKLTGFHPETEDLVRMATPDAALRGVEILGRTRAEEGLPAGVILVDIGGATTDVHSFTVTGPRQGYKHSLLPDAPAARTVEADLGMRWNAPGIVEAAQEQRLADEKELAELAEGADRRAEDPGLIAADERERDIDRRLAVFAIATALRRHAGIRRIRLGPDGAVIEQRGRDLTEVDSILISGGVLAVIGTEELRRALELAHEGREDRLLPVDPALGLDRGGVLTAAGLLSVSERDTAQQLVRRELIEVQAQETKEPSNAIA